MTEFKPGCVIPAVESRIDNLNRVLKSLSEGILQPREVVVVCDGWFAPEKIEICHWNTIIIEMAKHEPGQEQPRNVGVKWLHNSTNYVWFLDSDCLVDKDTLLRYKEAFDAADKNRILVGPYEWMGPGAVSPQPHLHNDPRWTMFNISTPDMIFEGEDATIDGQYGLKNVALANFSGNLMWPVEAFKRVGGFWNELHMGRCEDGELGVRAASLGVPMSIAKEARAYHMHHDVDNVRITEQNKRDVALLNRKHPWLEEKGIVVVDEDGKRFDQICPGCGESINTLLYWDHAEICHPLS